MALLVKVFSATVIVIAVVFTFLTVGPAVETNFFPVVSKLRIVSLTQDADGNSVVQAQFTKYRDCTFIGIAWFRIYPEGDFERVPVTLLRREGDTSSPNRPLGTQRAGPWIIGLTNDELLNHSFATLSHECSPLWISTTNFYP